MMRSTIASAMRRVDNVLIRVVAVARSGPLHDERHDDDLGQVLAGEPSPALAVVVGFVLDSHVEQ